MKAFALLTVCAAYAAPLLGASPSDPKLQQQAVAAMQKAGTFYHSKASSHGGYVYYYLPDFSRRWGEGEATAEQIWVQPPGTPSVGLAYLRAYEATGDAAFLDAAREAAEALAAGQLMSGGWTYAIDFAPHGSRIGMYRNGTGGGTNYSTFDDGVTQGALRLIMQVDRALGFKNAVIHEASEVARSAVYAAQFQNGGFPQGWAAPVQPHPAVRASYPDYDWRTENRIKNYWDLPTLNDDLASRVVQALADAWEIYKDERAHEAILRFGNFLLLAQMPDPQPGWAQQYDHEMHPAWARKFEPPAIAGRESEDVIETLLRIHRLTHDAKYLEPIPRALEYLRHSLLPDGRLARYYELKTNQPLYMTKSYELTHDDSDAPTHYGWKTKSKLERLEKHYAGQKAGKSMTEGRPSPPNEKELQEILQSLDEQGRWISTYSGPGGFVGQLKLPQGTAFPASEVFARNMEDLAAYVMAARQPTP